MKVAIPDIDEWDKQTLLAHERDMLGLYVSDHPLMGLEHILATSADCTIGQLLTDEDRPDNATVTVCGLVTSVQRKITKRGDSWAMVTLEDLEGAVDVLLFPSAYQLASTLLTEDTIVTVKGRLSRQKDQPEIHGQEVTLPDLSEGPSGPVVISMPATRCTPPVVDQLRDVLGTHPGVTEVRLRLMSRTSTTVMRLDDRLRVAASPALYADLKALLGPALPDPGMSEPLVKDVVVVLLSFLVAALVVGVVWPHVVDPVTVERATTSVCSPARWRSARRSTTSGGTPCWPGGSGCSSERCSHARRRTHEVVTLLAIVAGACLAAWLSARVGTWLGPDDPSQVLADAKVGATAPDRVVVDRRRRPTCLADLGAGRLRRRAVEPAGSRGHDQGRRHGHKSLPARVVRVVQ